MQHNRIAIDEIISEMLDEYERTRIYETDTAITRLEDYIQAQRVIAIGWMHEYDRVCLDKGGDPRTVEVPDILDQARKDLEGVG